MGGKSHGPAGALLRVSRLAAVGAFGLLAAGAGPAPHGVGAGQNWTGHGGTADESDYSRLDAINVGDIGRLGLAWSLDLPGETSLEATPLAVDGMLYFTGASAKVYAVDGATGTLKWTYDPETWKHNPAKLNFSFPVSRGVAYAGGRIFGAALDGRLYALDSKTGALLWSVETTDPGSFHTVTGAPRTFRGKVIIGNAGADIGVRGYVTAYDQATGKQVWRFYVTPGAPEENKGDPVMERAAATWSGQFWKTGTGGGVWDSITFDPELNRIYLGTGNGGPQDPDLRSPGGGDNLYTASIVALDADTGKYVWHYQVNPRDSWDYDATQQMTLAELVTGGKRRKVLMQAPKNGFFYVLDRGAGKLISAGKIGKATWADHIDLATGRPVEAKNIRYETGDLTIWPGPNGAHSWQPMAYSPKTGLVYVPIMQAGAHYYRGRAQAGELQLGRLALGTVRTDPGDARGSLVAWDPVRQEARWTAQHDTFFNGGALATAGGLVFQGTADGYLSAYDAASGRRLWRFNAGLGVIAAPMSYAAQGKQYVSVLVGYGGTASATSDLAHVGWKFGAQPRRLLTFALDGKATLPPSPPPDFTVRAVDDPKIQINSADAAMGRAFYQACSLCHGRNLVSAGSPGPDLRESQIALDPDALWSVLHDGALLERGMPRFDRLTRDQAMKIYAYIRAGAREAAGQKQADAK